MFSDNYLGTSIAPSDGSVYESMLEAAREAKLNEKDKINGFEEHIKPLMTAKL
jgi:hypothetical protein